MIAVVESLWVAMAAYWLASASRVKSAKRSEPAWAHWGRIGLLCLAFEFIFSPWGRIGVLGRRFVPAAAWTGWAGLAVTAAGLALACWARHCLGANWSSAVMLKQDHALVQAGPYRRVRHPIYTGMWLGLAGTALAVGEWRGVAMLALLVAAHARKAAKEERWLAGEFGAAFEAHRARTGRFAPRWGRG